MKHRVIQDPSSLSGTSRLINRETQPFRLSGSRLAQTQGGQCQLTSSGECGYHWARRTRAGCNRHPTAEPLSQIHPLAWSITLKSPAGCDRQRPESGFFLARFMVHKTGIEDSELAVTSGWEKTYLVS